MTEESIGASKELAVCKNQLAHFRAAAKRLREQREQLRINFACAESKVLVLTDELEHLQAENAKLRELVHLMHRHDRVPSVGELGEWHDEAEEIGRRMRELGVGE